MCDRIAVLYLGRLMEFGNAESVFVPPQRRLQKTAPPERGHETFNSPAAGAPTEDGH